MLPGASRLCVHRRLFFGATKPRREGAATGQKKTQELGVVMGLIFDTLWLTLNPEKCLLHGMTSFEVLGILFNT